MHRIWLKRESGYPEEAFLEGLFALMRIDSCLCHSNLRPAQIVQRSVRIY